uniref:Uncharacterized protein n=1 Tax=Leersia perrieri TaxID=77586 RepID=A0A0D9WV63_9ORYZ
MQANMHVHLVKNFWYGNAPYQRKCTDMHHDFTDSKSFEELNPRAILLVVDHIKSAKGNFTMLAFPSATSGCETSSNILTQGLCSMFYSILISHRKNAREINVLKSFGRMGRRGFSGNDYRTLCRFPDMSESDKKNVEGSGIDS